MADRNDADVQNLVRPVDRGVEKMLLLPIGEMPHVRQQGGRLFNLGPSGLIRRRANSIAARRGEGNRRWALGSFGGERRRSNTDRTRIDGPAASVITSIPSAPLPSSTASNSWSLKARAPFRSSFSRGRSALGRGYKVGARALAHRPRAVRGVLCMRKMVPVRTSPSCVRTIARMVVR